MGKTKETKEIIEATETKKTTETTETKEVVETKGNNVFLTLKDCETLDISKIEIEQKFLPYIFVSKDREDDYKVFLKKDGKEIPLPKGWMLKHILTKESCRQLVGKEYTNRCYRGSAKFQEALSLAERDLENWQKGLTHALYVVFPYEDDNGEEHAIATIVTLETFGAGESYWLNLLKASREAGSMIKVNIEKHNANLKVSKAGREYLNGYKFTQWSKVPLDEEVESLLRATNMAQGKALETFAKA